MWTLYGTDYNPEKHDFSWILERTERCQDEMRKLMHQLVACGVDCVLEVGFATCKAREFYREFATNIGAKAELHFLDVPVKIRRERVRMRNQEQGDTFSFEVTEEMFDYVEPMFEPPTAEELKEAVIIAI